MKAELLILESKTSMLIGYEAKIQNMKTVIFMYRDELEFRMINLVINYFFLYL